MNAPSQAKLELPGVTLILDDQQIRVVPGWRNVIGPDRFDQWVASALLHAPDTGETTSVRVGDEELELHTYDGADGWQAVTIHAGSGRKRVSDLLCVRSGLVVGGGCG